MIIIIIIIIMGSYLYNFTSQKDMRPKEGGSEISLFSPWKWVKLSPFQICSWNLLQIILD